MERVNSMRSLKDSFDRLSASWKQSFYRFMAGRYGADQLSRFTNGLTLALIIVNLLLRSRVLWFLSLAGIGVTWFRMLSRNMEPRRRENEAYLALRLRFASQTGGLGQRFTGWAGGLTDRLRQSRDFAFFRCPSCRAMLRVPRHKGRIRVTCRKCGNAFQRKT